MTNIKLGQDEKLVLDLIKQRLKKGQKTYGPLTIENDTRDMLQETTEEMLDAIVYMAIQLLKKQREK